MAKVMVVDDDATMVSLLTTLLQLEGHDVSHPEPGGSILEAAQRIRPDVLLMDVNLAHEDGIEVLKAICAAADLDGTYIVMQSGLNVFEECISAGADAFILKPYPPDELLEHIAEGTEDQDLN